MRTSLILSFAAAGLLGLSFIPLSRDLRFGTAPVPDVSPGTYRSLQGTQFYDDRRDIRQLPPGLERYAWVSSRPITGGTVEPGGTFELVHAIPDGAEIKVRSGRYHGDRGWVKAWELGRVERIGDLPDSHRKRGSR